MSLRGGMRFWLASLLLAGLSPPQVLAADAAKPAITVQSILTARVAGAAKLGPLMNCVAVTPDGAAVVGDSERLWLVGSAGVRPTRIHKLSAFAFTPEGLLVGVRGRELVYLDHKAVLKKFFDLPAEGMTIEPGRLDSFFLFGPVGHGRFGLYVVTPGRKVSKVLQSPRPITSAAEAGTHILLTTGGALYGVTGRKLLLIAGEPGGALTSVAVDERAGRIYVSDGHHIFQIEKGRAIPLIGDLGGTLRWVLGGLLVFNPSDRVLVRLVGLP